MTDLNSLRKNFEPGQSEYEIPKTMPAYAVLKNKPNSFEIIEAQVPKIGHDEALVCVMACGLNYNTVWTIDSNPISSFNFLKRLKLVSNSHENHDLNYHIPGSDASGFIVQIGNSDNSWKIGQEVVINCNWHRNNDPRIYQDSLISKEQKIWGYETNFGGFAPFAVVKIHQLMTKPTHLSWFEAASYSLVLSTAYRMLISENGANIKLGDNVLIWGGTGGLGLSAIQICNLTGATPMPVVSSELKGNFLSSIGQEKYIDRNKENLNFIKNNEQDPLIWKKLQNIIIKKFNCLPTIVFEHPGKETMGASVYVLQKGGKVVTCAATTGYEINYDNRFLWMESKSIIGCHFANPMECYETNNLVIEKKVSPFVSNVYDFEFSEMAVNKFRKSEGYGKIVVGVLANTKSQEICSNFNLFKDVFVND